MFGSCRRRRGRRKNGETKDGTLAEGLLLTDPGGPRESPTRTGEEKLSQGEQTSYPAILLTKSEQASTLRAAMEFARTIPFHGIDDSCTEAHAEVVGVLLFRGFRK